MGFPGGAVVKNPPANAEDAKETWVEKIPWRRAWHPLQYSCLENPMDRGAWRAAVQGVAKSQAQLRAHTLVCLFLRSENSHAHLILC